MDHKSTTKAHAPAKIPRVGVLSPVSAPTPGASREPGSSFQAFRRGLGDLGYVEGRNIIIEPRFAEGQYYRFPAFAAELVGLKTDVICVQGAVTVLGARAIMDRRPISTVTVALGELPFFALPFRSNRS